jgi:hypothetical protein
MSLALKNRELEDKACTFTRNTLARILKKKSSPRVSLPPAAGGLKALPPRSRARALERPFPGETVVAGYLEDYGDEPLGRAKASSSSR